VEGVPRRDKKNRARFLDARMLAHPPSRVSERRGTCSASGCIEVARRASAGFAW
jgi:hypothetical protein